MQEIVDAHSGDVASPSPHSQLLHLTQAANLASRYAGLPSVPLSQQASPGAAQPSSSAMPRMLDPVGIGDEERDQTGVLLVDEHIVMTQIAAQVTRTGWQFYASSTSKSRFLPA